MRYFGKVIFNNLHDAMDLIIKMFFFLICTSVENKIKILNVAQIPVYSV